MPCSWKSWPGRLPGMTTALSTTYKQGDGVLMTASQLAIPEVICLEHEVSGDKAAEQFS